MSKHATERFGVRTWKKEVGALINKLTFTSAELADIDHRTQQNINEIETAREQNQKSIERRKYTIRENLSYMRENRLLLLRQGVYTPESYVREEQTLSAELDSLQKDESHNDITAHELVVDLVKLSELLNNAYLYYQFANAHEKESVVELSFRTQSFGLHVGI